MNTVYLVFSFLAGISVGSFLNVVAWRVPRGESIVRPGSRCTSCGSPIAWHDNVPVASWFVLRGRCRTCGAPFSIRYAMVELLTGLLFAGLFLKFGFTLALLKHSVFISLLICAVLTDIDHWIILDSVSLGGAVAGLAFALIPGSIGFMHAFVTAVASFTLFYLIRLVSRIILRRRPGYAIAPEGHEDEADDFQGGMGWGDIKLAVMIGVFLGPVITAVAFFLSFLTGALAGIGVMICGRNKRIPIQFGPFLALGSTLAIFTGNQLWNLYLRIGLGL